MDRRRVLKNMGLSLGYAIATPTLLSIVQSCKTDTAATWTPTFFSAGEGAVIMKLVDIILPKSDTPAASELNVHMFVDNFADAVMETEEQQLLTLSFTKFMDKAYAKTGKKEATDLTEEELEAILTQSLAYSKEAQATMSETLTEYTTALSEGKQAVIDDAVLEYSFANSLRGLAIWGYKASEYVGEEVLAYASIPGEYISCGNLEELTGGKAWSL